MSNIFKILRKLENSAIFKIEVFRSFEHHNRQKGQYKENETQQTRLIYINPSKNMDKNSHRQ